MTDRIPKRAKYLVFAGAAQAVLGYSMAIGLSNAVVTTLSWLPDWIDHDEIGGMWVVCGIIVAVFGLTRLNLRTEFTSKMESVAFGLTITPALMTLGLQICGALIVGSGLAMTVIVSSAMFVVPSYLVSGWTEPKKQVGDRILPPTGPIEIVEGPK